MEPAPIYDIVMLTIAEAADKLRLHRTTVSRLISTGQLPACRIGGRILIRHQDLVQFIENRIGVSADECSGR